MKRMSLLLVVCLFMSCKKKPDAEKPISTGQFEIDIEHVCGNEPLRLKDEWYTNTSGELFRVNVYQYFLSNFSLVSDDRGTYIVPESYFLINEAQDESKMLSMKNIPTGSYRSMEFLIGVDSARNVSGAQTGALDPSSGMFWDWNTGYIMAKLEGVSPQSTIGDSSILYHIGGYTEPNNSIRRVRLEFPQLLRIEKDKTSRIHMQGNLLEWFKTPTLLKISSDPIVMNTKSMMNIADNYSDMFVIQSVE